MKGLEKVDKQVFKAIQKEDERQHGGLELIASENYVSQAVLEAMGSCLTNKYAEGYPGKRYYGGCENVDVVEQLAIDRLKQLFGCDHANVQPHCGANANLAVYVAMLKPGDTILGMNLSDGGHLTHGSKVNISGKHFNSVLYGVDPETGCINYDKVREIAKECKPQLIVAGASAYPRVIDFKKFREIADEVGAYLMVDMAHIAGLIAAGVHPSPVPYADFITSTTHKTMRGPRGGFILCKQEYKEKIDKAIFPGTQGGPLEHVIAGKAVSFKEALSPSFKKYQQQVVKNAKVLADELMKRGIKLVSNGTDNHLMLLDLSDRDITGLELETLLQKAHITTNKNTVPNEKRKPFVASGLRIGTPAVTSRGMKEKEMVKIAGFIADIIDNKQKAVKRVREQVIKMCSKFGIR